MPGLLNRPFFWVRLWLPLLAVRPIFPSFWFRYSDLLPVGFAAHYYSWRFMQQLIGLVAFFVFFIIIFWLPETYHPGKRGVDKLDSSLLPKWRPVFLNPLRPLWLLRSPNLLAVVCIIIIIPFLSLQELKFFIGIRLWLALRL